MKFELSELLIAIKNNRSNNKEIKVIVDTLNKKKTRKQFLETIQIGFTKLTDKEIKKFTSSL